MIKEYFSSIYLESSIALLIDINLGLLDLVTIDVDKLFIAKKFKQYVANMGIIIKNALVEAHHSISTVKHYYRLLQQVYSIITNEILGIKRELALQISYKIINDLVGHNGLVPTLLVFGTYPSMSELDALSISITQSVIARKKAMNKVRKYTAS